MQVLTFKSAENRQGCKIRQKTALLQKHGGKRMAQRLPCICCMCDCTLITCNRCRVVFVPFSFPHVSVVGQSFSKFYSPALSLYFLQVHPSSEQFLQELFHLKRAECEPHACMEDFGRDCCICDYRVYKEIWQARTGEELECYRELKNSCER